MKSFTLAIRNVLRNKRRTLLTMLAIVSGVTGIVVFGGFIEFAFQGLREITIRTELGHVQFYREGYVKHGVASPAGYMISAPDQVEKVLGQLPHVQTITRRLTFSGLVSDGNKTLMGRVTGVMPEREDEFAAFETVLAGQQLTANMSDGGVIGVELAKALGAKVGDYLTVLCMTLDGAINAVDFQVVGIAQTGTQEYDSTFIKLPLALAQRALHTHAVEKILVLLDDTENLDTFLTSVTAVLAKSDLKLEYRKWDDLAFYYRKVVGLYNGLFDVIRVIIGVIVLFSIVNTMTMSVFERVREIGTLRAIGANRFNIMYMFLTEGLVLGILGATLGVLSGVAVALFINFSGGIDIPAPPGMSRGYVSLILIVPRVLIFSFMLAVGVAVLSSIWPAWKAAKIKVVEALAHM